MKVAVKKMSLLPLCILLICTSIAGTSDHIAKLKELESTVDDLIKELSVEENDYATSYNVKNINDGANTLKKFTKELSVSRKSGTHDTKIDEENYDDILRESDKGDKYFGKPERRQVIPYNGKRDFKFIDFNSKNVAENSHADENNFNVQNVKDGGDLKLTTEKDLKNLKRFILGLSTNTSPKSDKMSDNYEASTISNKKMKSADASNIHEDLMSFADFKSRFYEILQARKDQKRDVVQDIESTHPRTINDSSYNEVNTQADEQNTEASQTSRLSSYQKKELLKILSDTVASL